MEKEKSEINPLCGERIKLLCKRKKITQRELADAVKYSPHSISKVATGQADLSPGLARKITKVYPDVSIDWLLGDPKAKMNKREIFYSSREETLKKRRALLGLLDFSDFTIDFETPYEVEGFQDEFYKISHHNASVLIREDQLINLTNAIIDVVNSLLNCAFENGMTAKQLAGQCSAFAEYYLNDMCDVLFDSDLDEDEKKCIANFVPQAVQFIGSRDYESPIHPGQTESDILKEKSKEFQDE